MTQFVMGKEIQGKSLTTFEPDISMLIDVRGGTEPFLIFI
jgi:hypothetical protein